MKSYSPNSKTSHYMKNNIISNEQAKFHVTHVLFFYFLTFFEGTFYFKLKYK